MIVGDQKLLEEFAHLLCPSKAPILLQIHLLGPTGENHVPLLVFNHFSYSMMLCKLVYFLIKI